MRPNLLLVIGVILIVLIALAVRSSDLSLSDPFGDRPNSNAVASPIEVNEGEEFAVEETQAQIYVGHGQYVEVDWNAYRNPPGYLIPREVLSNMATAGYLMFEGEQRQEGIHDVLSVVFPDGSFAPQVGKNGLQLRDEGSFWHYEASFQPLPNYVLVDDLLMVFAKDKRRNWNVQGMEGNPIVVWLSSGEVTFAPTEEIVLSPTQGQIFSQNDAQRCPTGNEPLEENPLGDPQSHEMVVSQIGSSSCITLLVRGEVAFWFDGPRDGIRYRPVETRIFLLPIDWDEDDMREFLTREGISISALSKLQ
jgi:hypothetical protein